MKKYITFTLLLLAFKAQAQYILKEADKQFNLYNYSTAVKLYATAYEKKPTLYAATRLAESYRKTLNYTETEKWYATAASMPGASAENRLMYAQALQNNGKFDEAKVQFKLYQTMPNKTDPALLQNWILSCDSAKAWMQHPVKAKIKSETKLNSAASDWAPAYYQNGIVFTSDRGVKTAAVSGKNDHKPFLKFDGRTIEPGRQVYLWTGNNYNHLYFKGENDSLTVFPLDPGTGYHVGVSSFTANGDETFFALTRIPESIKKSENIGTINVEVYSSKKDQSGQWAKPIPVPFNKVSDYSVGDPFINKTGDTLYFSSNMPGGLGGTDLYRSVKNSSGGWATPENLRELNTAGNERSPALDGLGNFYFASDGRVGMGGLDIFRCSGFGTAGLSIENLKYPINSPKDDFAFSLGKEGELQYFSSNRDDGLGADDIYSLEIEKPVIEKGPLEQVILSGIIYDQQSRKPLSGALVTLQVDNDQPREVRTSEDGFYRFNVHKHRNYTLNASSKGYMPGGSELRTDTATKYVKDIYLTMLDSKEIVLRPIYYDFDKYNILSKASKELDRLVKILNDNPDIDIVLGSHTDSRGVDAYNLWLSQKRAESAVAYLTEHGIAKTRLTARGYGETKLVNRCSNGVLCSPAEHQANRRTEFKIKK